VVSFTAKWIIVDWPEQAKFLTDIEKARLQQRLGHDASGGVARMDHFDSRAFKRIVFDWKIYVA
jgi:hypothetical protein